MKRFWVITTLFLLLSSFMIGGFQSAAQAANCDPNSRILYGTDSCLLAGYDTSGQPSILTTCHNLDSFFNQNITEPGYDVLIAVTEKNVGSAAAVATPFSGSIELGVSLECNPWLAYKFTGALVAPNGSRYPVTFDDGLLTYRSPNYNSNDYCAYVQTMLKGECADLKVNGSYALPASAPDGIYSLTLHSISQPNPLDQLVIAGHTGPYPVPPNKDFTYLDVLSVTSGIPTPTPTNIPLNITAPHFSLSYKSGLIIVTTSAKDVADFFSKNSIANVTFRVFSQSGITYTLQPVVPDISGGSEAISVATPGVWTVESAGVSLSGRQQGPWSMPQMISITTPSPNPTFAAKAPSTKLNWTCVKGKTVIHLKGAKSKCSKGYTLKN